MFCAIGLGTASCARQHLGTGPGPEGGRIAVGTVQIALEELGFGIGGQHGEAQKGQLPIHVLGDAATLPPMLDRCDGEARDTGVSAP